jgi:RimJ/RimL family protein N-acetyltransferase
MIDLRPISLERHGVGLEQLTVDHHDGLAAAAADGTLWELWYTSVPGPQQAHSYIATIDRVEIGYTWYGLRWQRSRINTVCKLLLLEHGFDRLGCRIVGFRTDNFNFTSQRAIEGLGARRDGVIRHHHARRDGTVRDSVMYSILASEWPDVRRHLELRLARHGNA